MFLLHLEQVKIIMKLIKDTLLSILIIASYCLPIAVQAQTTTPPTCSNIPLPQFAKSTNTSSVLNGVTVTRTMNSERFSLGGNINGCQTWYAADYPHLNSEYGGGVQEYVTYTFDIPQTSAQVFLMIMGNLGANQKNAIDQAIFSIKKQDGTPITNFTLDKNPTEVDCKGKVKVIGSMVELKQENELLVSDAAILVESSTPFTSLTITNPRTSATSGTIGFGYYVEICPNSITSTPIDSDGDGVADIYDLDNDNDGILDADELYCDNPSLPVETTTGIGAYKNQLGFFNFADAEWQAIGDKVTRSATYNGITYTAEVTYTGIYNKKIAGAGNSTDLRNLAENPVVTRFFGADIDTWTSGPAQMIHKHYNVNGNNFKEVIQVAGGSLPETQKLYGEASFSVNVKAEKNGQPVPFQLVVFDAEATTLDLRNNWTEQVKFIDYGRGFQSLEKTGTGEYHETTTRTVAGYTLTVQKIELSDDKRTLNYNYTDNTTNPTGGGTISGVSNVNGLFETIDYTKSEHTIEVKVKARGGGGAFGFAVRTLCDTDKDGTPNFLDTDSDGDGCPDATEGSEKVLLKQAHSLDLLPSDPNYPYRGQIKVKADGVTEGSPAEIVSNKPEAYGVPELVNPAAANTSGTAGAADNSDGSSEVGQGVGDSQDATISYQCNNYWMGNTSDTNPTSWNTETNWTQEFVPASGDDVEFATTVNNYGSPAVNDLHVPTADPKIIGNLINSSNKDLVVTTGSQLTINGTVIDNNPDAGTIVVQSQPDQPTGTLIFTDPTQNQNVEATVEFYNQGYDCADCGYYRRSWQYFGIPITSATMFPASHLATPGGTVTVNRWDEPTNGNKWINIVAGSALAPFKGYEITSSSTTPPQDIYPFKGILNVGNTNVSLTRTPNVNYPGMNLVSNSYTAAIDIKNAITFPTGVKETVYLFNTGTRDQWRKLDGSTVSGHRGGQYLAVPKELAGQTNLPDRIPSMHAFMVQMESGTSANLDIAYDKLVKNTTVNDGNGTQIAWRSTAEAVETESLQLPNIVIDVLGIQSADRVWLFEQPGTTQAFDNGWDGEKIIETGLAQIYVAGSDGNSYQVATVSDLVDTRFGFTAEINGNYTLNLSVSSEVAARNLSLMDTKTGARVALRNGTEYTFTAKEGDNGQRFKIVASGTITPSVMDKQPAENEHYIKIYSQLNEGVKVINQSGEDCTIEVFDVTGKRILNTQIKYNSMETVLNSGSLNRGVYIVKVEGPTKREVKRILIQ